MNQSRYTVSPSILGQYLISTHTKSSSLSPHTHNTFMEPEGAIVFTTLGRLHYGFDVFSVNLPLSKIPSENRLTDGISINFNAQFTTQENQQEQTYQSIVHISERTGSPQIYLTGSLKNKKPIQLPSPHKTLFLDRPVLKNKNLYFVSAHKPVDKPFKSWSAIYHTNLDNEKTLRLTPYGFVDYSPAVSVSGELIAVASYQDGTWGGEFHDLKTDIVVFRASKPEKRTLVCKHGGWPTFSGENVIYFHRQAEDGWWSIFQVDLPENFELSREFIAPKRITPMGIHCFTPAASAGGKIAMATRRKGSKYRHIELYDLESRVFEPVTELLNPDFHHYNPFMSPESDFLGYHRFRGETDKVIPHLEKVNSPLKTLQMHRINGTFPSFSPNGDFIAINLDFDTNPGIQIVKSDGSMRWNLLKNRIAFCSCWSPTEKNVIFASLGPIFDSVNAHVQIARISFELSDDREDIEANVKILTKDDTCNNAFSSCSPDGKSIVFRSGRSGHKNLYITDAIDGEFNGENHQLTDGSWIDTMPSWSPKGDLIAFSSNRHNPENINIFSIYVVHPDGSGLRRIHVASDHVDRERINHVCFSPDGEWLLFTANLGGLTVEPVSVPNQFQPYGDLYVVRLDGSGLQRLTWNGYENGTPAWHPKVGGEIGLLGVKNDVGDKLKGEFDEPIWIKCDI